MTKRSYLYGLLALMAWLLPARAQTVHPYGLQQMIAVTDNDLSGTPRFIAMVGAMTAVGGDPSAVKINPAGLGIYRHNQFSLTADGSFRRTWQTDGIDNGEPCNRWHLTQVSYVVAITHPERIAGIVSNNIMLSYGRRADMYSRFRLNDRHTMPATATNWIQTTVEEYGERNDIDFHYAMNIGNRVYWGLGMTFEWLRMTQSIDRWEYNTEDKRGRESIYNKGDTATAKAAGFGLSAGLLVRPLQMLRIGLAIESPVWGKMHENYYFSERFVYPAQANTNRIYDSEIYRSDWQMATPLKATAGVGLQWKSHGLLSLQYDMLYHHQTGISHVARVALEAALTNHWMLEAGYAYSTLYTKQRAAIGVHYMGSWIRIGIAYSYSWSTGRVLDELYYTEQGVYRTRENKIVFSFQWNS